MSPSLGSASSTFSVGYPRGGDVYAISLSQIHI